MVLINKQAAIDELDDDAELLRRILDNTDIVGAEREKYEWGLELIESCISDMNELPSIQPEPYEDKLKEIADALSEKMCYMNTCPNERDIILGYLGRKRSSKNHCNTDCWNKKCESYHYETKQQPELCEDAVSRQAAIETALTYLVEYCGAAFDEDIQRGLKKRLDAIPSAQSELRKGEWEEHLIGGWEKKMKVTESEKYTSYTPEWYCKNCGKQYDPYFADNFVNYCYVCGADMREGNQK